MNRLAAAPSYYDPSVSSRPATISGFGGAGNPACRRLSAGAWLRLAVMKTGKETMVRYAPAIPIQVVAGKVVATPAR